MAFGSGASVVVVLTVVPGAPLGRSQDDGDTDSGWRLVRLTSGVPGVPDRPSSDRAPPNTALPLSAGRRILGGPVSGYDLFPGAQSDGGPSSTPRTPGR